MDAAFAAMNQLAVASSQKIGAPQAHPQLLTANC
jgi:hypothetical protein